jgi:molecular chaperone DnaJ
MTLYDVLGVSREASEAEVRRSYRRLARRYHPDLNPGDGEAAARYAAITRAYETLVDPARRRAYDTDDRDDRASEGAGPAFAGFDFSQAVTGGAASTFGDLFVDVFRSAAISGHSPPRTAGADVHVDVALSLDEVIHGATRGVDVTRRAACGGCAGLGRLDRPGVPCTRCQGTGQVRLARGHMMFIRPCDGCAGEGVVRHVVCGRCRGDGYETRVDRLRLRLPPGLADGDEWHERGQGHVGSGGGAPGDLKVRVRVVPDPRFTRTGDDLRRVLRVAVHEAVLGTRVSLETPDGPVSVRIPPGTQGGTRVRVRGRGVPSRRTGERGDLLLDVQIVLPPVIDARARDLMREFARLHPDDVRRDEPSQRP